MLPIKKKLVNIIYLEIKSWSLFETDSYSKIKETSFDNQAHSMLATNQNKLVVGCAGIIKAINFLCVFVILVKRIKNTSLINNLDI